MTIRITRIALLLCAISSPASADIFEPFTTANLNPFTRIHGLPVTRSARLTDKGDINIGVQLDVANHFTQSRAGTETILIDGETMRSTVSLRYGMSDRWEVGVDLPYSRHSGGSLDGFIENWHDWFGLPNGGRDNMPSDQINFVWADGAATLSNLRSSQSGIGDATIHIAYQLRQRATSSWAVRAGVKIPTGESERLTGSDAADYFASLHISQYGLFGRDTLTAHGSLGVMTLGDGDIADAAVEDSVVFGSATLAWRVHERISLKSQLDFNSAPYDSSLKETGDFSTQLTLGGSIALGTGTHLDLAVVEDIVTDTSPDVVLHIALRRVF